MKTKQELLDQIYGWADTLSSCKAMAGSPIPDALHLQALSGILYEQILVQMAETLSDEGLDLPTGC